MKTNQRLQLAGGIIEAILGFPVLGGIFILSHGWLPLLGALIFHIVTLTYVVNERGNKAGPIMGIIANTMGIIPFAGWILHIVAATFLLTTALGGQPREYSEKEIKKTPSDLKEGSHNASPENFQN